MNLLDMVFKRRPPIADLAALADFIDEQSAFVTQKGIYEYSRARAGHYFKVLFSEREFQEAIERSRWTAYPIGLAMVGEVVEGVLRPHTGAAGSGHQERLLALVLSVFDRYPVPPALGQPTWDDARAELAHRLQLVGLHPVKRAMDICEPYAKTYWELMPIHKGWRSRDFATTKAYLSLSLCNIHDELSGRMDPAALMQALLADTRPTTA